MWHQKQLRWKRWAWSHLRRALAHAHCLCAVLLLSIPLGRHVRRSHISYYIHTRVEKVKGLATKVKECICDRSWQTETVSSVRAHAKSSPCQINVERVRSFQTAFCLTHFTTWRREQCTNEGVMYASSSSTCNFLEWPAQRFSSRNAALNFYLLWLCDLRCFTSRRLHLAKWEKNVHSRAAISERDPLCTLLLQNSSVLYL
jgi:hypothetical protein